MPHSSDSKFPSRNPADSRRPPRPKPTSDPDRRFGGWSSIAGGFAGMLLMFCAFCWLISIMTGDGSPEAASQPVPTKKDAAIAAEKGHRHVRNRQFREAAKAYEQSLAINALQPQIRFSLILLYQDLYMALEKAGESQESQQLVLKAAEHCRTYTEQVSRLTMIQKDRFAETSYDEARVLCAHRKPEAAINSLRRAVELGFSNVERLKTDPALSSIRYRPDFARIVE